MQRAADDVRLDRRTRTWVWLGAAAVAPWVLVGTALTLSVYGAPFGVPMLLMSVPVVLHARRHLRNEVSSTRPLGLRLYVVAVVASIAGMSALVVGGDDVGSAGEILGVAAGLGYLVLLWVTGRRLTAAST